VGDLRGRSEIYEEPEFDTGAHLRKYIRDDPRSKVTRKRLESKIVDLVSEFDAQPDAPEDMLESVDIDFKVAVMQIALNAYLRVFRELKERAQVNRAKADPRKGEPEYDILAHLEQYLREDPYWKESRDRLESRAVELIPASIERQGLLEYVTVPYASAVLDIALAACIRAFSEEERARKEGADDDAPRVAELIEQSVGKRPRRRWPSPG
jgi:hypothetical protein